MSWNGIDVELLWRVNATIASGMSAATYEVLASIFARLGFLEQDNQKRASLLRRMAQASIGDTQEQRSAISAFFLKMADEIEANSKGSKP